jgi:hypothetical protein
MSDTNRWVIVALAALLLGLMVLVILATWTAYGQTVERLQDFAGYLEDHADNQSKMIVTLGALFIALLAAIVIIIEMLPPPVSDIRLMENGKVKTVISGASVREQIVHDLMALPAVKDAEAEVYGGKNGMEVVVDLSLSQDANIMDTTDTARGVVQEVAQNRIGVPLLAPPVVKVHFVPGASAPSQIVTSDEGQEAE